MTKGFQIRFVVMALFFCGAFLHAEDVSVTARLSSRQMELGQGTKLQIIINGGQKADKIQVPSIQGLEIEHISEMSNFQFINGAISSSVTHVYTVVPTSTGNFTIPPIEVVIKGIAYKTQPLSLQVVKASASNTPSPASTPSFSPQQQNSGEQTKLAFLIIHIPKKEIYVGEKVPVEVKAYFIPGQQVSLNSLPMLTSEAFTVADITEKYRQSDENINGQKYAVLTWNTSMDALKEGEYSIEGQLECVMIVRRQPSARRSGSLFDDFFSVLEQKQVTLHAQPEKLKILPLPEQGKPANFSGAVGQFQIQSFARPTKLVAGDPLTLTTIVTGKGNFDRISSPKLTSEEGFKTYTPTAKFEPTTLSGFEGKKTFEQAIIPQKTGAVHLPPEELNYFDPDAKEYKTVSTSPITLQIEASAATTTSSSSQMTPTQPLNLSASGQNPNEPELAPNKIELGSLTTHLTPLILQGWFVTAEFGLLVALVILTILKMRKERLMRDPRYLRLAAASKEIRRQLDAMENSEKKNDVTAFFSAARRALQQRLAEVWALKPDTITLAELSARLPENRRLQEIFEIADSVAYADGAVHTYSLPEWRAAVVDELQHLEKAP